MKIIENCPVCQNTAFKKFLKARDYTVSKEKFDIVECINCGFHFTNPIPDKEKIGNYYKSEKYISHSSSKKGLINYLYNVVRNKTLKNKVKWIKHEVAGRNLLDIGSGTGHFLKETKENGFNSLGIEPSQDAREFAHSENGVRSVPQEELYKIEKNSFDVITMWHVLEHIYDLQKDLRIVNKILHPSGKLFIAVPNMNSFDARFYKKYWAAYDVPRHLYHFKQINLSRLMLDYGFKLKKVIPMKYDAYYISMLSEKYRSRLFFLGPIVGFISNRLAKRFGYSSQLYIFEKTTEL
ncbi:MAG: class I SAM-dependent methyltransferase [Brumimicrobium sp.]